MGKFGISEGECAKVTGYIPWSDLQLELQENFRELSRAQSFLELCNF